MDLRQYLDSDDTLSLRAGTLFLEGCSLAEVARAHGTPLNVVSEERLRRRAREFVAEFSRAWSEGPVQVLPSLKANHSLALRRILTQEGLGCDTFGYGELRAALACGVPPELISVNGSGKPAQLIREAILAGTVLTLDSLREVGLARTISDQLQRRAAVRLRLRPDYSRLEARSEFVADEQSIGEVTRHYKPGLPHDDLPEAARLLRESEWLELVGCHAHVGRQRADLAFWGAAIPCFVAEIVALSLAMGGDWRPSQIDVGGGFAPRRDPVGLAFEGRETPRSDVPTVRQYADCVASSLREGMRKAGLPTRGLILQLEPGRGLYANCGLHLGTVVNLKQEQLPSGRRGPTVDRDRHLGGLPSGRQHRGRPLDGRGRLAGGRSASATGRRGRYQLRLRCAGGQRAAAAGRARRRPRLPRHRCLPGCRIEQLQRHAAPGDGTRARRDRRGHQASRDAGAGLSARRRAGAPQRRTGIAARVGVIDTIMSAADEFPVRFVRSGDELTLEATIGQRRLFLSRRTLAYRCRLRVDDAARRITFFEGLVERGPGLDDTLEPLTGPVARGVKHATPAAVRPPSPARSSRPLARGYDFSFRYQRVREAVERAAQIAGYEVRTVARERSV